MFVAESRRLRRLVGRLDRGEDLLPSLIPLRRAHDIHAAEVRVSGILEEVELCAIDPKGASLRPPHHHAAPHSIVHFSAILAHHSGAAEPRLEATCVLSRDGGHGVELVGGYVTRARVIAAEVLIESFDDLRLERHAHEPGGLALLHRAEVIAVAADRAENRAVVAAPSLPAFEKPASGHYVTQSSASSRAPAATASRTSDVPASPAASPATTTDTSKSWSAVAEASQENAASDEREAEAEEEPLRPGDVIDHPRFGPCEVERIEGNADYAQVRLRNRRVVRLSLDVLQLQRDGNDERGHRRYRGLVST